MKLSIMHYFNVSRKIGVSPHVARYEPIKLPENIHTLIDLTAEQLEAMVEEKEDEKYDGDDYIFNGVPLDIEEISDEEEEEVDSTEEL